MADIPESQEKAPENHGCKIGIIGRPNVGKSTLVNRLLGEERVVVYDQPGTTRDSIYIPYERHEKPYTLIDTAGVRRRKNIKESVEKFSIVKTLQAIEDSNVVVVVIDAQEGVVDQDLHLIGFAMDAGRALVLAVNKWDGMTQEDKKEVKRELDRRLIFLDYAQIHFISAKHGTGVGDLYKSIDQAYASAFAKWPTKRLTELLVDVVKDHQPPVVRGRRIKLRFAHQGGSNPPIIVVHGSKTEDLPDSYKRYLENTFRKVLKVKGTPIRFEFKSSENPYATPSHKLTEKDKLKQTRVAQAKEFPSRRAKSNPRNKNKPKAK
jgi:GTP-binding protein